jgi:3'-5' exonuclease
MNSLQQIPIEKILFLDIETVPQQPHYSTLDGPSKILWEKKSKFIGHEGDANEVKYQSAGIYAEFGKIVCISAGYFEHPNQFRIKSFYGDDEVVLLKEFASALHKFFSSPYHRLCAHNGKEFDFPFLSRRYIINQLPLPAALDNFAKKPWEILHLDTMELWKFGDYKAFTSLQLLAHIFNIPTPKDDIDGSMVWHVYWNDKNLERIATYCQKDVITVARIFQCMRGEKMMADHIILQA